MKNGMGGRTVLIGLLIVGLLRGRVCAEDTSAGELHEIQLQIQKIKAGEERERERMRS
jgi:hypothetical protein